MSRCIVVELDKAAIGFALATYGIVGFPAIKIREPRSTTLPTASS